MLPDHFPETHFPISRDEIAVFERVSPGFTHPLIPGINHDRWVTRAQTVETLPFASTKSVLVSTCGDIATVACQRCLPGPVHHGRATKAKRSPRRRVWQPYPCGT